MPRGDLRYFEMAGGDSDKHSVRVLSIVCDFPGVAQVISGRQS